MSPRRGGALWCLISAGLAATGCASEQVVDRAYDGQIVEGRFIEPEAYSSFLAGVISESEGDFASALASYERAERLDPAGPEIWTRIGSTRCALHPRDPRVDEAFSRALAAGAEYTPTWWAKASCERRRGQPSAADAAALRATQLEYAGKETTEVASYIEPHPLEESARRRIVEVTMGASNRAWAFRALAEWAEAHDDLALWSRALMALAKIASPSGAVSEGAGPREREAVAAGAEALAGSGAVREAQAVAAAMVDAFAEPPPSGHELAARLALDEAIARRDIEALRRRAVRTRLGLDEAAGRAWLNDDAGIARDLASEVAHADPRDAGARLILSALDRRDVVQMATSMVADVPPVSAAVWTAFGTALARATLSNVTRPAMARIAHDPLVAGDERVVRAAVALVSEGYADAAAAALPPDGLVELHVLRAESAPVEGWSVPVAGSVDAIHMYLALAFAEPNERRTHELGGRLARILPEDRLVAVARCLVLLGSGAQIAPASAQALLERDPTDPLVAATALRLAEKAGDLEVARRVRAAMKAIAGLRADSVTE